MNSRLWVVVDDTGRHRATVHAASNPDGPSPRGLQMLFGEEWTRMHCSPLLGSGGGQ